MPAKQGDQSCSADKKAKKSTKKADAPSPAVSDAPAEEPEVEEEVQEVPKKRYKKPQSYDEKGQPCYKKVSEAANTGRKAAPLTMGMEPKSVSPFPNPAFKPDSRPKPSEQRRRPLLHQYLAPLLQEGSPRKKSTQK